VRVTLPIQHPANGAVLFSVKELACRSDGQTYRFAEGFPERLLELRMVLARPMKIGPQNSCCRTPTHNAVIGGAPGSFHLTEGNASDGTCAIDVHVPDDQYRRKLASLALSLGWSVGVYPTFLHLDTRGDYGLPSVLFYGK
jgi:hypothetical protein